jgi:mono/diheme cytochrome c family protein
MRCKVGRFLRITARPAIKTPKSLPSGAPATDAQVRKTIIEGRGTMPAFDQRLSEEEVNDLVKYLHTLK